MSVLVGGIVIFRGPVELEAQAALAWDVVCSSLAARVHIAWGPYCRVQPGLAMLKREVDRLGGWQMALPFMISPNPIMDVADDLFVYDPPAELLRDRLVDLDLNRNAVERVTAIVARILSHDSVDRVRLSIDADESTRQVSVRVADLAQAMLDAYTPQGDVPSAVFEVRR